MQEHNMLSRAAAFVSSRLLALSTKPPTMMMSESSLPSRLNYNVHEIPSYLVTNHIQSGYRANLTVFECLKSIFYLHNETLSIWTHLVPSLIFVVLAIRFLLVVEQQQVNHKRRDVTVVFAQQCACFAAVFGASAFMHTFNPVNQDWYLWTMGLDWGAVALAILGCGNTLATLAYHNDNRKRQEFWKVAFGIPCTIFASVASSGETFHLLLPPWAKISFALLPFASFVAFVVDIRRRLPLKEWAVFTQVMRIPNILIVVGCLVYATEFPERYLPNINFDISRGHHLFHHLWSTAFAFVFLRNTLQWAQHINAENTAKKLD